MEEVTVKYELYSLYGRGFEDVYSKILLEYDKEDIGNNGVNVDNLKIVSINSSDLYTLNGPYSVQEAEKDIRERFDDPEELAELLHCNLTLDQINYIFN